MKRVVCVFFSIGACVAWSGDALRLLPLAHSPVRLRAEPLQPVPVVRNAAAEKDTPPARRTDFRDPVDMILFEMVRWVMGTNDKTLPRAPFGACAPGMWVSLGGMALPSISVSKVTWTPRVYTGGAGMGKGE